MLKIMPEILSSSPSLDQPEFSLCPRKARVV